MNKQKILNKIKERIDKEIKFFDKMDLITYIIKMKGKWKTGCKKKINTREGYYICGEDWCCPACEDQNKEFKQIFKEVGI